MDEGYNPTLLNVNITLMLVSVSCSISDFVKFSGEHASGPPIVLPPSALDCFKFRSMSIFHRQILEPALSC